MKKQEEMSDFVKIVASFDKTNHAELAFLLSTLYLDSNFEENADLDKEIILELNQIKQMFIS